MEERYEKLQSDESQIGKIAGKGGLGNRKNVGG